MSSSVHKGRDTSRGKDGPLSRKLQAWDRTTYHDLLCVRNVYTQTMLCGYFGLFGFVKTSFGGLP